MALREGEKVLRKVIITAAITGAGPTPTMSDNLPWTPKQIADNAVGAYEAGAAIVHIHARNPENGKPTPDLKVFREILSDIKRRCPVVICVTTGGAGNPEERIAVVPEFKPELATVNLGTLSGNTLPIWERMKDKPFKYAWEEPHLKTDLGETFIFQNTFKQMREYSQTDKANNTKPELEVWDTGQIENVKYLIDRGFVDRPIHLQFVMGALSGMPATPGMLVFVLGEAKRQLGEFTWSVAAVGRDQIPMAAVTLTLGGNVRVGIEDSIFAGYGRMARNNAEQVERIVNIAREMSILPATPDEARTIMGLKGLTKVNF